MPTERSQHLRSAIVGCGRIAGSIEDETVGRGGFFALPYGHAPAYRDAAGVDLIAAVDPIESSARAFADRWNVSHWYASTDEMLSEQRPDVVSICTPSRYHAEVFAQVASFPSVRGVFLEKPVGLSLSEARTMERIAETRGVEVVVNHTRTFDPVWAAARRLIDDNRIGSVVAITARWAEGWSFGGSHLFDLIRFLTGSHPVRAYCDPDPAAALDSDAGGTATLVYASGIRVQVVMLEAAPGLSVTVAGTDGRIVVDPFGPRVYRSGADGEMEVPFPAMMYWRSAMVSAVEELVSAVENGTRVTSGLTDGIRALEIAVALNLSARSGAPVDFPVDDDLIVPAI